MQEAQDAVHVVATHEVSDVFGEDPGIGTHLSEFLKAALQGGGAVQFRGK